MGTAVTVTRVNGPDVKGSGYEAQFSLALDSTDATGIQTIDLTDYFSYVWDCQVGGNDTLADNGYKIQAVLPGRTVPLTATNLSISVHQSDDAVDPLDAVASTSLSAIGALMITVTGKAAV